MFPTAVRRFAQSGLARSARESATRAPLTVANNPYKTRKVWPPNFAELSPQQQLRFEKKYKRRIYLAHHSESWDKGVRMLQFVMITGAVVYALFFAEFEWWGQKYKPSEEIVQRAAHLFGIMEPEKRYERRQDTVPLNPKKEQPESKSD